MAFESRHVVDGRFVEEPLVSFGISHLENDVHNRTIFNGGVTSVKTFRAVNHIVEQLGFGLVEFGDAFESAHFFLKPLADHRSAEAMTCPESKR